ncbi:MULTISPECIES: 2OG-Fe(II) oxygenase [Vibrio]|jgi:SM-20-related protein|uniref:2OG-Fe(II) oxygenase n=1 Tax=Vibrio TaxID=662 RepID=UPI000634FE31|nr:MULTISPECIES: 2OG-Fe(II) oxygenase [Vibrio]MCK8077824.1 2OG-Fe(II) oxygenase [Vibrio sp. 1CM2L]MCK8085594.1 2OG-Fe(II) oxygenase [Vibrio sp. 1CM8B]MCY9865591.1 2OG-Fe(II) oxygenase [Vibrio coralliirubri]CDT09767.1 Prolyl 4-hydroxylase alpha subunit homologue [Vibrio coralliirubri]CDT57726.1 Prolyl 4-hydroxylase alpha subunit homologue [Vibrio coralliirubri]
MNQLIDALSTQGYFVWDDFLTQEEVVALRDCIPENWKKARIGRNDEVTRESTIRSDKIQWVRRDMGQPASLFLDKMEQIRLAANQAFFLGLFEYEAHFAKYEKGDFYQKHLDCFKGNENRRLTTVFYMNDEWTEDDAGELVVYDLKDNHIATIPPKSGRLFVFLSEQFPHEVLPTNTERFSIAGWFRINGVKDNQLDIAH